MGTAAHRQREFLYLLLIGTQKRMLSISINRLIGVGRAGLAGLTGTQIICPRLIGLSDDGE